MHILKSRILVPKGPSFGFPLEGAVLLKAEQVKSAYLSRIKRGSFGIVSLR
jgi:hypothetical protein